MPRLKKDPAVELAEYKRLLAVALEERRLLRREEKIRKIEAVERGVLLTRDLLPRRIAKEIARIKARINYYEKRLQDPDS